MQYIYFSNISVFFIAFLLQLFFFFLSVSLPVPGSNIIHASFLFHWWKLIVTPSLLHCWGSAKVVLYIIFRCDFLPSFCRYHSFRWCSHVGHSSMLAASVELKKRENRNDIDFFTNERLRTLLWYLGTFVYFFLPETSACGNKPLCLWCTWCSTALHSISVEARIYICNLHLWFKKMFE